MPIFFDEKNVKSFCIAFALQKLLSFLQLKKISVYGYKVVKHLNELTS